MTITLDQKLVRLDDAVNLVPGNISLCTLRRWARVGFRGIRLETVIIGKRRFTTEDAIVRFLNLINEPVPA